MSGNMRERCSRASTADHLKQLNYKLPLLVLSLFFSIDFIPLLTCGAHIESQINFNLYLGGGRKLEYL